MKTYVIGAGVSVTAGYPSGRELFAAVDQFVRSTAPLTNHFNYKEDWNELIAWLSNNQNPTLVRAYIQKQLEAIFTVLDDEANNYINALSEARNARDEYWKYRQMLLWALQNYFEQCNEADARAKCIPNDLGAFAKKLCPGDVVINFNYDPTLVRALLSTGKWNPSDGYWYRLEFKSLKRPYEIETFPPSVVKVLHLHGAIGWYQRRMTGQERARIKLSPHFLHLLGLYCFDSEDPSPIGPVDDEPMIIHPSYHKDYERDGSSVFLDLWRCAAGALRESERVVVIGYSLPQEDDAALMLLLTNTERSKVDIVNNDPIATRRLRQLLSKSPLAEAKSFETWLSETEDCASPSTTTHADPVY